MFIKPAAGLKVRVDAGRLLADEGEEVVDSVYWQRRLRDGDVVLADPPQQPAPEAPAPAEKST